MYFGMCSLSYIIFINLKFVKMAWCGSNLMGNTFSWLLCSCFFLNLCLTDGHKNVRSVEKVTLLKWIVINSKSVSSEGIVAESGLLWWLCFWWGRSLAKCFIKGHIRGSLSNYVIKPNKSCRFVWCYIQDSKEKLMSFCHLPDSVSISV